MVGQFVQTPEDYIRKMRRKDKQAFAQRYLEWLRSGGAWPKPTRLTTMTEWEEEQVIERLRWLEWEAKRQASLAAAREAWAAHDHAQRR